MALNPSPHALRHTFEATMFASYTEVVVIKENKLYINNHRQCHQLNSTLPDLDDFTKKSPKIQYDRDQEI